MQKLVGPPENECNGGHLALLRHKYAAVHTAVEDFVLACLQHHSHVVCLVADVTVNSDGLRVGGNVLLADFGLGDSVQGSGGFE